MKKVKKPFFTHCALMSKYFILKTSHWSKVLNEKKLDFFLAYIHVFLKIISFNSKVLKSQPDSSITLHVSLKTPISADKLKITSTKIQMLSQQNFPEWFGQKKLNLNVFESILWKISLNWGFQRNLYSDIERAQPFEHCYYASYENVYFVLINPLVGNLSWCNNMQ